MLNKNKLRMINKNKFKRINKNKFKFKKIRNLHYKRK